MSRKALTKGQELFLVAGINRGSLTKRTVTVTAVGKKWATLDYPAHKPYRITLDTWRIDGGDYSSPGECFPSEQEYNAEVALSRNWSAFRRAVENTRSADQAEITVENIQQAAKLLGLKLEGV